MEIKRTRGHFISKERPFHILMKIFLFLFCTTAFSLAPIKVMSQNTKVTIDADKTISVDEVFEIIKAQTPYRFIYRSDLFKNFPKVAVKKGTVEANTLLERSLSSGNFNFELRDDNSIIIIDKSSDYIQQQIISGKVTDKSGAPLPGVNVIVKGTKKGTATDFDGNYVIPASVGQILSFSYVGFITQEITVENSSEGKNIMNITMEESVDALDNIIITGYNNVIKKKMTGSVSEIDTKDVPPIETKIDELLQGRVPGLSVINTSGAVGAVPVVKIRGTSTLTGNSSPLWVVDGVALEDPVPLTPAELNTPDVVNRIGNALSGINPQDIESITVLKDASATAIYGVRAAGGVIVLTTKKGKVGKPVVNFSLSSSLAMRPSYDDFNLMNSKERIGIEQYYFDSGFQYYNSDANINSVGLAGAYARYKNRDLATWEDFQSAVRDAQTYNTDWFDILFRDAISTNANFNVSGGGNKVNYYASLGMVDQNGTDKFTDNKRYTASIKLNTQLSDDFNLELYLSSYRTDRSSYARSLVPSGISNFTRTTPQPFDYAINTSRTFPVNNPDGSPYMYRGHNDFYLFNILNEYENSSQDMVTNGTSARVSINTDITDNFTAFGVFNYTQSSQLNETYYKENTNQVAGIRRSNFGEPAPIDSNLPSGGVIFSNSNFQDYYTGRIALEYTPIDNEVNFFQLYGGGEYRVNNYRGDNTTGWGYLRDRGQIVSPSPEIGDELAGTPYLIITDYTTKSASYFGVATYSYLERYVLNLNIRYDGSNLFGSNPEYRWKPAWSVSGRWNIMEENFMEGGIFNNLSIRGSYGLQGSINLQSTPQIIASFQPPAYWSDLNLLNINSPANPDLRWEKTYNTNLGFDFALWNSKIYGAVDLYYRKSEDLITDTRISEVNGFSTLPINFADVSNKGIEFGITSKNIRNPKPDFNWSTTVNFAYNKNEVLKVNTDPIVARMLSPFPYKPDAAVVGKPLNALYSVAFHDLGENGVAHFQKADGEITDAVRDLEFHPEDLVYNGPIEAPYQGGITNLFEYRGFQLSTLFTYGFGNYFRKQEILEPWMYSPDQNLSKELLNSWRIPGNEESTNIPYLRNEIGANTHKYYWNKSDIRVVKGDYLRLSNVTLKYYLSDSLLKHIGFSNAFLQLEGNNLSLFADDDLDGYDPETFPYHSLPIPTSFLLGFNVTF